jgi:hypothetical protein
MFGKPFVGIKVLYKMSITQDFSKIALIFIISKILKVCLKMKTILIKDRMKIELL